MSRSGYSDDCENVELWRSNVARSIAGKKGQAFLRELVAALEAMPEKKLITEDLERDGCYCTLGVVGAARGVDMSGIDMSDDYDAGNQIGTVLKMPAILAQEIMYLNDEYEEYDRERHCWVQETDEQRYERMLKWAKSKLKITASPSPAGEQT